MQRSAVSVPSNIAEGYERSDADFVRFSKIAKGSAAELCTHAYIAARVDAITNDQMVHISSESKELMEMMQALANARSNKLPTTRAK